MDDSRVTRGPPKYANPAAFAIVLSKTNSNWGVNSNGLGTALQSIVQACTAYYCTRDALLVVLPTWEQIQKADCRLVRADSNFVISILDGCAGLQHDLQRNVDLLSLDVRGAVARYVYGIDEQLE